MPGLIDSLFSNNTRPRTSSDSEHRPTRSPMNRPVLKWVNQRTLNEAINTPLPTRPARARLPPPPSFQASPLVIHPPPFCDNLTRSTLPTASLSPPLPVESQTTRRPVDPIRPPPIVLLQSNPTRTSVDSLRSVTRSVSTHAPSVPELERSNTVSSKWWFQSDTPFFAQDDRSQQKDKEDDKKNCQCPLLQLLQQYSPFCRSVSSQSRHLLPWLTRFRLGHHRPRNRSL